MSEKVTDVTDTNKTVQNMVMTIHDPTVRCPKWDDIKLKIKYFAYAEEHTEEGKLHYQAYARSWKPMRLSQWRVFFPNIHMEKMLGTFRDNQAYCSKEGKLTEFGEKPEINGHKSTVTNFKRKIDEGVPVMEIAEQDDYFPTYLQYRNGFKEYAAYKRQKNLQLNRDVPDVYVRLGPGGTGKTRWLDDTFGLDGWRFAPDNKGQWFDHCDERDVIVFDDVEAGQIPPLSLWKRLCDRYPFPVPVKGGFITWKPKVIVFTSNKPVSEWWPNITELDRIAIERRIKEVIVVE